ncbi:hypothetical protein NAT51_12105 [Flavobacterium amniphilum]|uniref:hypothetical protein n=1 Tax=Flavobacterium amniphilum TaxID=1834035 RepID=UPI002029C295|nr:hypothetical protein [Flavobacterium amniphilum]MCL9806271.1 hypothetical protein [Flavobacterium amniphilum]
MRKNYMYKYILFFMCSLSFGQTPFSKENPNNTLALKACGYINLLDGGFGSIVGVEKGFMRNNSIGVKLIYNHFLPRREDEEEGLIDYTDDRDLSLIAEYKHYLNLNEFRERTGVSPYISANYKKGRRTIDHDRNYDHDYYHRETDYEYFGPAVGAVLAFTSVGRWAIDTQISYLSGIKKRTTDYVVPFPHNSKESFRTNYFRFEIMLTYNINWM